MPNKVTTPSDYELTQLEVIYQDGSQPLDLRLVYQLLEIYEDIFSNSISGKILIYDTGNFIQNGPILGFEQIGISFNSPNKIPFSGIFQIFNISNREPIKERSNAYIIEFCSPEQIQNSAISVGKAYTGKIISDISNDIQKTFLKSSFNLIEPTKNLHSFIIPIFWSPFDTLNWLSTRANSQTYSGANYLYFQNKNGYNFVSLEKLVDAEPTIVYFYGPANIKIPGKGKDSELISRNIENYTIENHINLLDNLGAGMYTNRIQTYDFLNKKFAFSDFNYSDSYEKTKHLENPNKYNSLTQNSGSTKLIPDFFQNQIDPNSTYRFHPDSSSYDFPNRVLDWLPQRLSQLQEINNIKLKIVVPGDSERTIGEVVSVALPSNEPIDSKQLLDNYFQGKYLITGLKHCITQNKYSTSMELSKDSLFSSLPY